MKDAYDIAMTVLDYRIDNIYDNLFNWTYIVNLRDLMYCIAHVMIMDNQY